MSQFHSIARIWCYLSIMRISRDIPSQLIVEHRPMLLATVITFGSILICAFGYGTLAHDQIWGVAYLLMGLGFTVAFWLGIERVQIIFDKSSDALTFRSRSILRGYRSETFALSEVSCARLERQLYKDREAFRPIVVMHSFERPIIRYAVFGQKSARAVDAINRWLDSAPAPA